MIFDWDEKKNASNLRKHGVSFEVASLVFEDPHYLPEMDRDVDGEQRWNATGLVRGVLLLVVAHTFEDADGEEIVRIISARSADHQERKRYEEDI